GRLEVHPNTVARAFGELEKLGVLTPRRGVGMEVTATAPDVCRAERLQKVRGRIREALLHARSSALSAEEIRGLVEEELAGVNGRSPGAGGAPGERAAAEQASNTPTRR